MSKIVIIRSHGCTVKELSETLDGEKVIFQCAIDTKVPYWDDGTDGALGFLKRVITKPDDSYSFSYKESIPKTLLSGIDKKEFEICYNSSSKWLAQNKWTINKEGLFIYPNKVAILYHLFVKDENNLLHCSVVGSNDTHTLGELIKTLKKEFLFFNAIYLVPVCRTIVDDVIDSIDTPTIESSGHFSYKMLEKKDIKDLEENILSAIERNNKNELNSSFFYYLTYLKNDHSTKTSEFKQKIINDYKGFNLPTLAENVLELIDVSLSGEDEIFEFV